MTRKATAPAVTDALPTREDLERQAAEVGAQLDALRQQEMQREQEEQHRRAQAERAYDVQQAGAYSRTALDAEVAQARAAFDQQLADTPLVQALVDRAVALQRRRNAVYEHVSALNRLGRPTEGVDYPPADIGPVQDIVAAAVQRLVAARTDADAMSFAAHREAAITAVTEAQEI